MSIVAHFPVDEYPPHPAEAQLQAANIREQGMREALEPFATIAENFKGCGAPDNETCAIKFGLTYGDFRRAREALRPRDQEDPRPAIEGADDRNV
ncbi:hypothetical protein [Phenylobacterium sp.]|uniref:hypothetical protein n=1 Tax=Phenylobacterium sp. TaxID=1871053 RepID=UPI002F41036F